MEHMKSGDRKCVKYKGIHPQQYPSHLLHHHPCIANLSMHIIKRKYHCTCYVSQQPRVSETNMARTVTN